MSERLTIAGLVVLISCSDGKLRMVSLDRKQTSRVRRFVAQLQGGKLGLFDEELILLTNADAEEIYQKATGRPPTIRARIRKLFSRTFALPRP